MLFIRKNTWTSPQLRLSRVTEISTLAQITGKVIDVSRTHIPLKALTGLVRNLNSDVKAFNNIIKEIKGDVKNQP